MKLSESVKPISLVKARMSEIVESISRTHKKVVITHNGEVCAVLQDIESYEKLQDSLAMLKIVAMSSKSMIEGKGRPAAEVFVDIRKRVRELTAK
jgi:prevent-host-death family protein